MNIIFGGSQKISGYTTIDINGRADITHDIRLRWPFKNNSADVIFGSHVLEHLTKNEGRYAICECNRILRVGGILRVVVPDFRLCAEKYVCNDEIFYDEEILNKNNFEDYKCVAEKVMHFIYGMGHKYQYDFELLYGVLSESGFDEIERKEYRQSNILEIDLLDNRQGHSLFVEARKYRDLDNYLKRCVSSLDTIKINLFVYRRIIGKRFPFLKRTRNILLEIITKLRWRY